MAAMDWMAGEEAAGSFDLEPPGTTLYVTNYRVAVASDGSTSLEVPLGRIESCGSRGRRLDLVWRDDTRMRASLVLSKMPAAAAESAICGAVGACPS